jgi:hypothetical protein
MDKLVELNPHLASPKRSLDHWDLIKAITNTEPTSPHNEGTLPFK